MLDKIKFVLGILFSSVKSILVTILFFVSTICNYTVGGDIWFCIWVITLVQFIEIWEKV